MASRRSSSRGGKKSRIITVDFTNVTDQKLVDEGEYACKVVEIEQKEGDKADYLAWKFEIIEEGKFEGVALYTNTSLSEQSLWNLRNLMEAMGFEVEKKSSDLDLDEFIDAEVGLVVTHDDSYDGKPRNKVAGYYEIEEEKPEKEEKSSKRAKDGKDEEKTRPASKKERRGKKEKELEALDSADVADMDEGELEEVVEKYDLDIDLDEFKTNRRKANAVIDALESAGHLA